MVFYESIRRIDRMPTFPPIFLSQIFSFVAQKIVIVHWKAILLQWNYLTSMRYGHKNVRRRKRRNVRAMILILVALNVKDLFGFVKVGNGKMMLKLKDKDYFWMSMRRKKLVKVKEMGNPCTLDMLSLSWNELVDNFSAGSVARG